MRRVVTYRDLGDLLTSDEYAFVRRCPQIAESVSLKKRLQGLGMMDVTTFSAIMSKVDREWAENHSTMEDMTRISGIISSRESAAQDDDERLWLSGCKRRLFDIWSAINLLEEAGVDPQHMVPDGRDEALLLDIWNSLIGESAGIQRFRANMSFPDTIQRVLEGLGRDGTEPADLTVIVHGFYFLTPIQERLVRMMEGAGISLVFLIPYDSSYGYAHEIWRMFYSGSNGFPDTNEWELVSGGSVNHFGDVLMGRGTPDANHRLVRYGNLIEMVRALSSLDSDDTCLYSPDSGTANEILQDFFPEQYGRRTVLSYPIGGFISALHKMWDPDAGGIVIDPDLMEECFVYGWVMDDKGRRSNALLNQLHGMLPFFTGCHSVEEWDSRLELLHQIQSDVVSIFRSDSDDPVDRRWDEVMGNPFISLSMFDVNEEDTDSVTYVMRRLLEIAEGLFGDDDVDLGDHTSKLMKVLEAGNDRSTIMAWEYKMIDDLLGVIGETGPTGKYPMTDIARAMRVFLDNDVRTGNQEDSSSEWVRPLYDMDGNSYRKVHILLCDMKRLPGGSGSPTWPLSGETLERIRINQSRHDDVPLIGFTSFILENVPVANRYLIYSAFKNEEVTLSWVEEISDKLYAPSPYIKLLERWEPIESSVPAGIPVGDIPAEEPKVVGLSMGSLDVAPEARIDYALCPRRFLYGYLLADHPTYSSRFNQGFVIGGLVAALFGLRKDIVSSTEEIQDNIREMFPNLTSIEMQNIFDKSGRIPDKHYEYRNNREYTNMRHWVEFPAPLSDIIGSRLGTMSWDVSSDMVEATPDTNASNGGNGSKEAKGNRGDSSEYRTICMYCPHEGYCRMAKHGGDAP